MNRSLHCLTCTSHWNVSVWVDFHTCIALLILTTNCPAAAVGHLQSHFLLHRLVARWLEPNDLQVDHWKRDKYMEMLWEAGEKEPRFTYIRRLHFFWVSRICVSEAPYCCLKTKRTFVQWEGFNVTSSPDLRYCLSWTKDNGTHGMTLISSLSSRR